MGSIATDAVIIADAGGDIAGTNGGIPFSRIPWMRFMSNGVHVYTAQLRVYFFDI